MHILKISKRYCICQQEVLMDNSDNYLNICKKCLEKLRKSKL